MNSALIVIKPDCRTITKTETTIARGRVQRRQRSGFSSSAVGTTTRRSASEVVARFSAPTMVAPRPMASAERRSRRGAPATLLAVGVGVSVWLGAIAWVGGRLADPTIATAVVSYVSLPFLVLFKPSVERRRYRR